MAAGISRRDFINKTAFAGAGIMIVPRHVLGRGMQAPSDTLNIATVGVSGMGSSNTNPVLSQNIVAFCDVDFGLLDCAHRSLEEATAAAARRHRAADPGQARPQAAARTDPGAARREREAAAAGAPRT